MLIEPLLPYLVYIRTLPSSRELYVRGYGLPNVHQGRATKEEVYAGFSCLFTNDAPGWPMYRAAHKIFTCGYNSFQDAPEK